MNKKYIYCKKCFENNDTQQYQCCSKCREINKLRCHNSYIKHKEKRIAYIKEYTKLHREKVREWNNKSLKKFIKNNPKRFKTLMNNNYIKNKNKYYCRRRTHYLLYKKYFKDYQGKFIINNECKRCKSKENLEIHHEIYPDSIYGIVKAINEDKIYYLCYNCHRFKL